MIDGRGWTWSPYCAPSPGGLHDVRRAYIQEWKPTCLYCNELIYAIERHDLVDDDDLHHIDIVAMIPFVIKEEPW